MEILRDGLQTKINVSTLKLEIGISHCWEYRQRSCLGDFVCGSSVNRTLKQGFLADDIHKSSTHLWGENELANVLFFMASSCWPIGTGFARVLPPLFMVTV